MFLSARTRALWPFPYNESHRVSPLVNQLVLVHQRRRTYYLHMIEQTYRYIVSVDGIRSGRPIVEGTRIGVHDVVGLCLNGATVDEITREFPLLSRAQVFECLAYYEDHKADIDLCVAEQMADDERTDIHE